MTDQNLLVPAVVKDERSAIAEYAGIAGFAGMKDTHDVQQLGTPMLRWKLMGTSAGKREGGKFYNSLEEDVAYSEVPAVFIDGKNSRSYYAGSYDPKAMKSGPAAQPDCKSNDGIVGIGTPGGNCEKCPLSRWGKDGTPPACALSYDRLMFDFHTNQLGIMSFAKSKIKALQEFEKTRKARNGGAVPMWAYKVIIRSERKDAYWVPKIEIEGVLPTNDAVRFFELKKEAESAFLRTSTEVITPSNIESALDDVELDPSVGAAAY
jgi:hypothetical protein